MADRRDGLRSLRRRTRGDEGTEPAYPAHWEADIALGDGSAAHLRPIRPADDDALQNFHQRQSEHSRYLRFFAPMPRLSARDLARFTNVDHVDRVAFIVLVGQDIIAVGRYDRILPHTAEVAFNVSDSRQGTGLASVLLEHLAAAARERGINEFTAEVLPQNAKMIKVFTETGFDVARTLDDGVVMVSFRIDPTARSLAVMAEREHRAESRAMERLLNPRSVLLIGVSSRADSTGGVSSPRSRTPNTAAPSTSWPVRPSSCAATAPGRGWRMSPAPSTWPSSRCVPRPAWRPSTSAPRSGCTTS